MSKYKDNVSINDLLFYNKENEKTLKLIYDYLITFNNNEVVIYLMSLLFSHENINIIKDIFDIKKIIYEKYEVNKRIVSKYYPNILYVSSIEEIENLLKRKNPYTLFEEIDISNVDYYSVLWENIHS